MDAWIPLLKTALEGGVGLAALVMALGMLAFFLFRVHPQMVGALARAGEQIAAAGQEMARASRDAATVAAEQGRRDRRQVRSWMLKQDKAAQDRAAEQERAAANRHTEVMRAIEDGRPTGPGGHR